MTDKKFSIADKVFLSILLCGLLAISSCASQSSRGAPVTESVESESQDKSHQGPKVFGRGYYSDIKHDSKFDHSVKNTWKVSPDGSSGSMSQTFIRTYEHTTKGEHGTIVGPADLGRYGGY